MSATDLRGLADFNYPIGQVGAPISSGSFLTIGMVIVPCSARTTMSTCFDPTDRLRGTWTYLPDRDVAPLVKGVGRTVPHG
jgi:hypothetical protein